MSSPRKRETKIGYDFHGLKAHVSRCLLRQLCKRIVTGSTLSSLQEEAEHHGAVPTSRAHHIQRFYGALIFVDISGFTALSTKLDIESLTTHINGYFRDMLAIVESYGGDVVKFAGDAMYIIWHARSFDERQRAVLKAVACAKEIIKKCNNRTVPLSPTQLLSSETILKRVALTQSLLSGQAALDREYDPNSDSYDDEDLTTSIHCHDTTGTLVSDDLASQESPRSPRVTSHRRRNSMSSHSIKSNSRRLSFPSFMNNKESNDSQDLEVASLNVHIGAAVGILAGIDVAARGRSEFFLTGQPLLDVAAAESLAKLGQIVVSRGVYDFLKQNKDLHNNYECVSAELDCYRITEPIVLSYRELELQYGPAADVKRELAHILSISSGFREEYSQRTILLKCLSSHVHEAARMQSPSYSRCNTPPSAVTPEGGSVSSTQDDVEDESGFSSVYSSTHSDDSFDLDLNELGVKKELLANTSFKFERKISFDGGMTPDVSLSAELRELVILFIKIEIDVSLTHSCAKSPSTDSLSPSPARSPCSVNRSTTDDSSVENFKVDNFGFLERSSADEAADIVLRERFQECMTILADAFAEHGGQIGQYSCCEKGNVCLGTFGLRGSVQEDNAAAAIESAQTILVRLQAIGLDASIGVTSGKVYSGLVGSPSRHEYSIMGPAANLSSRLMCAAAVGTILSDNVTRNRDRSHLFLDMPKINAKGYSEPVRTYQPVMSDTFRRRLYSRKGSMDSCNEAYKLRPITDDPDVFGMMALDKLSMARSPDTFLYGRNPELSSVTQFLLSQDTTVKNFLQMEPVRIAIVTGACGCGKTCFLAAVRDIVAKDDEFVQSRDKGVDQIFSGGSNSYDTTVPFNSWRPVLTALIAAVSKNKKSLAAESDSNKYAPSGRFSCLTTFSPIETGPRIASFSPLGRFDMEKNLECATHSKPPSPVHVPSFTAPAHFEGCTNSPSAPGTSLNSPRPNDPRYNHLRAGSLLIAEALPQQILSHLHTVLKILPSFSKALKGAPKAEPHLTGAVKLQKTVVVLAAIIQTAVELLGTRRIFITL
jgi:class 3 adenylate cyclase